MKRRTEPEAPVFIPKWPAWSLEHNQRKSYDTPNVKRVDHKTKSYFYMAGSKIETK